MKNIITGSCFRTAVGHGLQTIGYVYDGVVFSNHYVAKSKLEN